MANDSLRSAISAWTRATLHHQMRLNSAQPRLMLRGVRIMRIQVAWDSKLSYVRQLDLALCPGFLHFTNKGRQVVLNVFLERG